MTLENSTFNSDMFQNLESGESLFIFTIFDQEGNIVYSPTPGVFNNASYTINYNASTLVQLVLHSNYLTVDFYFNPLSINLPVGTYNINCYFTGINAYFDQKTALFNNTANFMTFTVVKTVPTINMSILLNPTNTSSGVNGTSASPSVNNTVSYIYRQQPYLLLKIQSPVSIAGVYNPVNDIPGVTTITDSIGYDVPIEFNDVDGNGVLVNRGTIVDGNAVTSTTITNITNTKVVQFKVMDAVEHVIECVFVPTDTTNYTSSTFTITLTINKYKPKIFGTPIITIPNPTSPALNILNQPDDSFPNEINYDESFTITNDIQRFDNTIVNYTYDGISSAVDYKDIDGTIAYTYKENGSGGSSILSGGDTIPVGTTISILFLQNVWASFSSVLTTGYALRNYDPSLNITYIATTYDYIAGQVLTINLSSNLVSPTNFGSLNINIGDGAYNMIFVNEFRLSGSNFTYTGGGNYFTITKGDPPRQGTLTLPTNLVSITPSNNYLNWTTIVKPQQIPKNDVDGYTLSLQLQPSSENFVYSDKVDTSIYMTIANALGTLTLAASTPQNTTPVSIPVTLNYSSGPLTLSGQIAFINDPAVDIRTGTISFSYTNPDINNGNIVAMSVTAPITGLSESSDLTQTFSVETTELTSKYNYYTIYAKYTPATSNYPSIMQGNTLIVQVNPLMKLSFSPTVQTTSLTTGYQNGVSITAKLNTGVTTFTGGQATFTFTPTNGNPSIYTATQGFTDGIITFNTNDVNNDNTSNKLSDDLIVSTYTITCSAQSGNSSFQVTTQLDPIYLTITAAQIPFNLSIDKPVIFYKEANKLLPVLTATFNSPIIGGTGVSLNWVLTGVTNTTPYTYTQNLSNAQEYIAVYKFRLPVDLPVDTYTISCSITSPNYGTYVAANNGNVFLSVNKNNDVKIVASSVPVLYTPVTYPSSITVTASLQAVETLTQGNIMFLLIDTNTLITGTRTTGQIYTATFSGLDAGVYDVGIYFGGNNSYNASPVVYSSIVIKKSVVSNTNNLTSSYTTTGADYKVQLTLPITVTSSDIIVYNDLTQEPIYRSLNTSLNTVIFSDTLLKKGSNDIYVHVSNNNTITSFPTLSFTVPKIGIASISVTPSVTTTTYNSSVTFTATVASSKTSDNVNEGEIVFILNNTSVIKYVPVSNNVATASFVLLDLGSSNVTAKYINSINYQDSTTASCNVTVNTAPITLTLTKNNVTTISKQAIVTATLSTASDNTNDDLVQTGTVTFTTVDADNNSTVLFRDVPVRNSVSSVEFVISYDVPVYNITAVFSGNARYSTATSDSITITPTLGTIVTDYKSVTFVTEDLNTGWGFMTVTATVTPVQNNYFYKNNGTVVFSMNGVFMNVKLSNGTAVAKFVLTSSGDTPTVTFQNLDYYSDMLTGSVALPTPSIFHPETQKFTIGKTYSLYNNTKNEFNLAIIYLSADLNTVNPPGYEMPADGSSPYNISVPTISPFDVYTFTVPNDSNIGAMAIQPRWPTTNSNFYMILRSTTSSGFGYVGGGGAHNNNIIVFNGVYVPSNSDSVLVNVTNDLLDRNQYYTLYNNTLESINVDLTPQWSNLAPPRFSIEPNKLISFKPHYIAAGTDRIYISALPYPGSITLHDSNILMNNKTGVLTGQNPSLLLYKGVGVPSSSSSSNPVASPLSFPAPYGLLSKVGDQSVELLFESVGKYFNVSSSPSVSITNPVTATLVSATQKKITISGLTTGVSYTFTLTATNATGTQSYTSPVTFPAAVPFVFTTSAVQTIPNDVITISQNSSISASYLNNLHFEPGTNMSNVTDGLNFTITGLNYNNGDVIPYATVFANHASSSGYIKLGIPTISIASNISVVKIYSTLGSTPFLTLTLSTDGTTITVSNVPDTTNGIFYFN